MGHITVEGVRISTDHYIGGERVSSTSTFEDISPIDETSLGPIAAGGSVEIRAAVEAAQQAFPAWSELGPAGRGAYLRRFADLVESHVEELAAVETTDNGSLLEASRLRVMKRAASNIRFFADFAQGLQGETWNMAAANAQNKVLYQPAGVTAIVTPWNAPLMLATWRIGPALAAGNTVVVKPPEWAPLTNSLLADYAHQAGLPAGVFNVVQGLGNEAGAALVSHPGVRRIAFTGSPATGRVIGAAAAHNITPVSFELGGKSPFIVFEDADLEKALATALDQYDNAGQVCLAGTRLLVQKSIADQFLERMVAGARHMVLGDPRKPETQVGPLITRVHLERVKGFVQRAQEDGGKVVYGGRVSEELGGLYFEPTLFIDMPQGSEILKREVFGPVLTFQTFETEEEAIAMGNDTDYGLAATVFTGNEQRAQRVGAALNAGTVWINCFFVRDLGAPFGGNKQSGIGREGGLWSFDFYCDVKTVCHRLLQYPQSGSRNAAITDSP
jgi:betaine-aldehyde dehydrogenase/5-carboxymethyl-2-hydroxymuconic-semialdehyde dehydrogenase